MNRELFFGESYVKGFRRTVAVLCRLGANPELARELAQAAWVRGWECLGQLRDDGRVLEWVNSIAVRLLQAELTRSRRVTELSSAAASLIILPSVDGSLVAVDRIVKNLTPRQQELIVAVYAQDRTPGDLAQTLGISVGAIHRRLSRLRCRLRRTLAA